MRWLVVGLMAAVLGLITAIQAQAQACSNPGTYSTGGGSLYEYSSAQNVYELCLGLLATPTPTSTPTATPTPTLTPTPNPTAVALATETGCSVDASDAQRTCVLADLSVRTEAHAAWWQPILFVTLLLGFALAIRRQSDRA